MKKWVLGILFVALIATLGYVIVDAHPFPYDPDESTETTDYYPYYMNGMMGRRGGYCFDLEEDYDYEFLYTHLSSDDKITIDKMYADELAKIDFDSLSDEEILESIKLIKLELAQYIVEQDMFSYGYPYQD